MKITEAIERARAAAEALRAEYPDLEADADLWDTSVESMTDALDVADWLIGRALDRESMASAAKERADALKARAERFARSGKTAKAAALAIYESAGIKKRETVEWTASLRAGQPAVVITDAALIPAAYLRQLPPEPNKTALKEVLQAGARVPGAELSNGAPSITVRTR